MTTTTGRVTTLAAIWDDALCAQVDNDLFFPDGMGGAVHHQTVAAKKVCGRCPAREACLAWALDTAEPYGVWGGMSEHERRLMRGDSVLGQALLDERPLWQVVVESRADEFRELEAQELKAWEIGRVLGINAKTVHKVREVLAEQEVKAA